MKACELPYARKWHRPVHNSKESLLCPGGDWCRIRFDGWGENPRLRTGGRDWRPVCVEADRARCKGLELGGVLSRVNGVPAVIVLSVLSGGRPNEHEGARALFCSGALGHRAWGENGCILALPCTAGMEKQCGYQVRRTFPLGPTGRLYGWTEPEPAPRVLWLSAEPAQDVYSIKDDAGKALGYACVPSYADSVRLNAAFRRIRENDDLDLQEASDAEDDFESCSASKFVSNLEPTAFRCVWRQREQKWFPVSPAG